MPKLDLGRHLIGRISSKLFFGAILLWFGFIVTCRGSHGPFERFSLHRLLRFDWMAKNSSSYWCLIIDQDAKFWITWSHLKSYQFQSVAFEPFEHFHFLFLNPFHHKTHRLPPLFPIPTPTTRISSCCL